jgi:hypothetical protein
MMKHIKFMSREKKTIFSPVWDYDLAIIDVSDEVDIPWLRNFLLEKEKELLLKYPPCTDDGGTRLGINSVTSKYSYYTIWEFEELNFLKELIRKYHDKFLNFIDQDPGKIYSQGWYNVMRTGEQIKEHGHIISPEYSYLSAHLTVACENTSTYYRNPITSEVFEEENSPGKLTFFPSYITHYTDAVVSSKERITMAFDIYNEVGYNEDIFDDMKYRWYEL